MGFLSSYGGDMKSTALWVVRGIVLYHSRILRELFFPYSQSKISIADSTEMLVHLKTTWVPVRGNKNLHY
jgi:hypothetical protein